MSLEPTTLAHEILIALTLALMSLVVRLMRCVGAFESRLKAAEQRANENRSRDEKEEDRLRQAELDIQKLKDKNEH